MTDAVTRHRFTRRAMLRGLGVSVALPWMESMNVWGDEASPKRAGSEAPVWFACLFSGNGFHKSEWGAEGAGSQMKLGKVLTSLVPHREKMLFIQGLYNAEALKGNIHSSQTGNLLSGAPPGLRRDDSFGDQHRSADCPEIRLRNEGVQPGAGL